MRKEVEKVETINRRKQKRSPRKIDEDKTAHIRSGITYFRGFAVRYISFDGTSNKIIDNLLIINIL